MKDKMSKNVVDKSGDIHNNVLLQDFYRPKKELSNQYYSTVNPEKLAKLNELEKAREKIKQEIIAADKSTDNSVLYAALVNFKKENKNG